MAFYDEAQRRRDESLRLKHEARILGVELDPSEGQEGLRERVEAAKAGDFRACYVDGWRQVKAEKAQQRDVAQKLAIVNGTFVDDARAAIEAVMHTWWDRSATFAGQPMPSGRSGTARRPRACEVLEQASRECDEEIRRRQRPGVFSGSMPVSAAPSGSPIPSTSAPTYHVKSPEDLRAENRRLGEEIAKAPPEWAYPLAWRLAVMAHVEWKNNRTTPERLDAEYTALGIEVVLQKYHKARLSGLTAVAAMRTQSMDTTRVDDWTALLCQAYERGRPGPGGVHLGRSA